MYKLAILNTLIKVAEEKTNKQPKKKDTNNSKNKPATNKIREYKFENIPINGMAPNIPMDPDINATAVNMRDILQEGSGKDLTMPVHAVNDFNSAYLPGVFGNARQLFVNPDNSAVQAHEYGHAIDHIDRPYHPYVRLAGRFLHPSIESFEKLKAERNANSKGDAAFFNAVKDENLRNEYKAIRQEIAPLAYSTYDYLENNIIKGSLLGSAGGATLGYLAGNDTPTRIIGAASGAYFGGHIGGIAAKFMSRKKQRELGMQMFKKLRDPEYAQRINAFNQHLNEYMIARRAGKIE